MRAQTYLLFPFVVQVFVFLARADTLDTLLLRAHDPRAFPITIEPIPLVKRQREGTATDQTSLDPLPPGSVTTNIVTSAASVSSDSPHSSVSSTTHNSKSGSVISTTTSTLTISGTKPTTTTTSKTSSGMTIKMNHTLQGVLGVYTIVFTLFLLPVPHLGVVERLLIAIISAMGWIILFFESIVTFLHNPTQQSMDLTKSFKIGLLLYGLERWHTFQLIRGRAANFRKYQAQHATLHAKSQHHPAPSSPQAFHLGAWWKTNILESIKSHNTIRDHVHITQPNRVDYVVEAYNPALHLAVDPAMGGYPGPSPSGVIPAKRPHPEEDIFSSDEDGDTSPLTSKLMKLRIYHRANADTPEPPHSTPGGDENLSSVKIEESKDTCVDEGLSPREKVAGFIGYDAMKRDSEKCAAAAATFTADVPLPATHGALKMTTSAMRNAEPTQPPTVDEFRRSGSEMSTSSGWEKEAMGAAV